MEVGITEGLVPATFLRNVMIGCAVVFIGLASGFLAVVPFAVRLLLAIAGVVTVLTVAERRPRLLILSLFGLLPFLGLLRRLLIPVAGWSGTDPLLMISPAAVVCLLGFWVNRRPNPALSAPLSRGVTLFILIATVQMFNPLQGLAVGPIGGLFMIPPLLWFYVGAQLTDDSLLDALFSLTQAIAVVTALYGLYQTFFGLLPVEQTWVVLAGYNSLFVGDVIRAISTFASSAEYALYLNVAMVITVARAMETGRIWYLLPLAIYFPALFLESSRGPIVFFFLTVAVMYSIRAQGRLEAIMRLFTVLTLCLALVWSLATVVSVVSIPGPLGPLVEHQVFGLLNPNDEKHSTANLHGNMFWEGIWRGVRNPFGRGVGSITLAASKFGVGGDNWEVDLSNAFYALGISGGLMYFWLLVAVIGTAIGTYRKSRNPMLVIVTAILLVAIGQWWNGGYYVTTPLVWLLIGYLNTSAWSDREKQADVGG